MFKELTSIMVSFILLLFLAIGIGYIVDSNYSFNQDNSCIMQINGTNGSCVENIRFIGEAMFYVISILTIFIGVPLYLALMDDKSCKNQK